MGGWNPAIIDSAIASIIGYNMSRIQSVYNAVFNVKSLYCNRENNSVSVKWIEDGEQKNINLEQIKNFHFKLPPHWRFAGK